MKNSAKASANSAQDSFKAYFIEQPTVGGVLVSVDKFGLSAPYIGVASTIIVAAAATAAYAKRVKHRKEKQ